MSGSNGHVRRAEFAGLLKSAAITRAGETRQAAIDRVAKQVIEMHERLVDLEVAHGIRKARPVRKAGLGLAEQLREIAGEGDVAKSSSIWSGLL